MKKLLLLSIVLFCASMNAQLYTVPIYSATSKQTPYPGYEPSRAFDGKKDTYYSTMWEGVEIPDELNFTLYSTSQSIKQIVYTPYQDGSSGRWTNVSVYYSKKSQPDVFINIVSNLVWLNDSTDKVINLATAIQDVAVVRFAVNAAGKSYSTCAEMKFLSESEYQQPSAIDCIVPTNELVTTNNDIKVNIIANGSFASSYQGGENIEKSFDGDLTTLYHSSWSNTPFPVTLNYRFDGNTKIDYLKQIPRTSGGSNGRFGNVTIKYNTTSNATFVTLMNYDFAYAGSPVKLNFPTAITPLNIQIIVANGQNGYASCAEMEFYANNNLNDALIPSGIFANEIYSALLPGVTQNQINAISSQFYKSIAQCLFNGTYNSKYRTQKYEVYKPTSLVHQELKVNGYDQCENATGIYFKSGERIVLFVKNLPTDKVVPLELLVKNFEEGNGGTNTYYGLKNGLNVVTITGDGLGYINYFNTDLSLPDVEINIVNGTVNGYYNIKKNSPNEWPELLQKAAYTRIDIVGEYVHMVYRRDMLQSNCPYSVVELISKYDEILRNERMLMGWFKYNRSPKNHLRIYSDWSGTSTYSGGNGVSYAPGSTGAKVTDYKNLSIWGISHEFGHNNQVVDWHGMAEVTNNIYSIWNQYKMLNNSKYSSQEVGSYEPGPGIPSVVGGAINGSILTTKVKNQHFQIDDDVTRHLTPFWQLELYYQLAGASRNTPELSYDYPGNYTGVDYARWFGTVAEATRNTSGSFTNGEKMLNFVKNTCDAVQEDLTDFFKDAGFLKPIDRTIDDYGLGLMQVTQAQVDETIASIKSKGYQKPVSSVINYISANSLNIFKDKISLSGSAGVGVTLNNTNLVVDNTKWPGAVAFEEFDVDNNLIYVAIVGTGDISVKNTTVYYPSNASAVFAVGYDGKRIQVYPAVVDTTAPVINVPANVAVNTDAGKSTASNVTLGVATATDNSGVPTITNNAPATYPIGVTNVVWTAKDNAGNTATKTQTVTVADAEAPVISAPANVTVNTDAGKSTASNVTLGVATATDNAGVPIITNNAPATYPIGVTNVIWTAKDNAGNTVTKTQTVTVKDVEAPVISAPANVTVNTDAGKSTASNVTLGVATATDNAGVPTITNNAPATYPIGVTNVIWTATDSAGNISTAVSSVLVKGPATVVLNTIGDSFVRGGSFANDNYGTQPSLYVKEGVSSFGREIYLKFDLSTLPASFEKATLRLNIASSTATASGTTWQASYVPNDNWTETEITWNNKPSSTDVLKTISGQGSGWVEWNITEKVLAEVGQDKILTLKISSTATESNSYATFRSKDHSNPELRPQLYVNVNSGTAKMVASSEELAIAETTVVNKMVLYPNPTTTGTHLSSSAPMEQIRILNVNGQQLFIASGLSTLEYDIDVENLPQGFYFIQVNGNGWQKAERLIKK